MNDILGVSPKLPMLKNILVLLIPDLMEIIHVQLPYERWEVFMPKVSGEDFLLKLVNIQDGEVGAFFIPCDDVIVHLGLGK